MKPDIRPGVLYAGKSGKPRLVVRLAYPTHAPLPEPCVIYTVPESDRPHAARDCTLRTFRAWGAGEATAEADDLFADGRAP